MFEESGTMSSAGAGGGSEAESRGVAALRFGMFDGGTRDSRLGWRLASAVRGNPGFEVNLHVTRRDPVNDGGDERGACAAGRF